MRGEGKMSKIEYLFYCAVLNGVVLLAGLFIFYLAGRYDVDIAACFECAGWEILVILIAMLAAELGVGLGVLVSCIIKCCCEKPQPPAPPNDGGKTVAQTNEAKAQC
jgi:hypothetical protein